METRHVFWDLLNQWLEWPILWVCYWLDRQLPSKEWLMAYKVGLAGFFVLILAALFLELRRRVIHHTWKRSFSADDRIEKPEKTPAHIAAIEAARDVNRVVEPLKKAKAYDRVAEVYASVNQPRDAAVWYEKAGKRKLAAQQWALAGETQKAAALLLKEGEYATAARFFEELRQYGNAASAYEKAGDTARAASAYARAGKSDRAAQLFEQCFESSTPDLPAAEACYEWLQSESAQKALDADRRSGLMAALAPRFESAGRDEIAAQLYRASGQSAKAGTLFAKAGLFQEAARCLQDAGRIPESRRMLAKHYETAGRWEDAAKTYAALGEHRTAADAFAKAGNKTAAANSYEKAGEYYRAAAAYAAAGDWPATARTAAKVGAGDPKLEAARALLGQALFELKDYTRSAQVLEELLAGKWIDAENVALMYALGVAWESAGDPGKAREAYRKVGMFNPAYKDVAERLARCGEEK